MSRDRRPRKRKRHHRQGKRAQEVIGRHRKQRLFTQTLDTTDPEYSCFSSEELQVATGQVHAVWEERWCVVASKWEFGRRKAMCKMERKMKHCEYMEPF